MKYYLIAGEASGDLHASRLMQCLKSEDKDARFRFFGGDLMSAVGGTRVKHYKELAYMGFLPVLLHLRTIIQNMKLCKADIVSWQPDVVILVDYPGFNLRIAKYLRRKTRIPVYYYISPKIWAWKEWRVKAIKRDVNEMFSILPFEVSFYEERHHYKIHYVGNPTVEEVAQFLEGYRETYDTFCHRYGLDPQKRIVVLLAGSREQEIKDNLPAMIEATRACCGPQSPFQMVLAGAPSIGQECYSPYLAGSNVVKVDNETYSLLAHSTAALVTSGTATLETALFNVPQVVCYKTAVPRLARWGFEHVLKCDYISLVNLVAGREVVPELFADRFSVPNITNELSKILPNQPARDAMLRGYEDVRTLLGHAVAPQNAARIMVSLLRQRATGRI